MVLTLLAILIAALVVLAVAGAFLPQKVSTIARMVIVGLMAILAAVALALPDEAVMRLALDPMSASFLLLVCLAAVPHADGGPLKLAGTALALLAADGFVLVVGVALAASVTVVSPPPLAGGGWGRGRC